MLAFVTGASHGPGWLFARSLAAHVRQFVLIGRDQTAFAAA